MEYVMPVTPSGFPRGGHESVRDAEEARCIANVRKCLGIEQRRSRKPKEHQGRSSNVPQWEFRKGFLVSTGHFFMEDQR